MWHRRPQFRIRFTTPRLLDLSLVLGWALCLRILFALLTSNTYDPDEFVLLGLSRSFSQGAVPYRDFMFFHPPGILVLLRAAQPLINLWWPLARALPLLADTITAGVMWRIGLHLYGRRGAVAAGLLYGASPLALITAVRIGQDPFITMLGVTGLAILLTRPSYAAALLAGVCLAIAVWIKYPAFLFLPIYILAAPRRAWVTGLSTVLVALFLFAPFASDLHALVQQTVLWQRDRPPMALDVRRQNLVEYWLVLNVLALPGLMIVRRPRWLVAGFCLGAAFACTPQVYYHYLAPVVPFASLLAVQLVARLRRVIRLALVPGGLALAVAWALAVDFGASAVRLSVTASHFSEIRSVVQFVDRSTSAGSHILTDRFEYAYLAHRQNSTDYFWNLSTAVSARYLERRLGGITIVVVTDGGTTYPDGFVDYLADHPYPERNVGGTDVWLLAATTSRRHGAPFTAS